MIHWIVIVVLVIAGIIAIKISHLRHRVFIILLILLALFLYSSMALVVDDNEIDLNNSKGIMKGLKIYTGWLANGFRNLKALTGRAIDMDWTSINGSFFGEDGE